MLIRNQPWDLLNDINKLFENGMPRSISRDDSAVESSRWIPSVDIKEDPEEFILYVDIPGVNLKDIDISMENNILTIKGTREETALKDKNAYHRIERVKGSFYRRFTLPDTADAEQIVAKSKQGVLQINIGKKKIAKSRKIEIEAED